MKNYETTKDVNYYALIRASNIDEAAEIYFQVVGTENFDAVNFQEVSNEYVIQQHRELDSRGFEDGELKAVIQEVEAILNNDDLDDGVVLLLDGNLL